MNMGLICSVVGFEIDCMNYSNVISLHELNNAPLPSRAVVEATVSTRKNPIEEPNIARYVSIVIAVLIVKT